MRSKGQTRTIEALVSIAIISLIIFLLYFSTPVSQDISQFNRKVEAYNALKILDQTGNLRYYSLQANATRIEELLLPFLKTNYKIVLYNQSGNITEIPNIDSRDVISVSYLISGDFGDYRPIEIRVYLW